MTKQNTLRQIEILLKEVFDNDQLSVTEQTTAKDIEEWDSLNHIQLIGAIEDHFDVQFDLEEMLALENVGDIVAQVLKNASA